MERARAAELEARWAPSMMGRHAQVPAWEVQEMQEEEEEEEGEEPIACVWSTRAKSYLCREPAPWWDNIEYISEVMHTYSSPGIEKHQHLGSQANESRRCTARRACCQPQSVWAYILLNLFVNKPAELGENQSHNKGCPVFSQKQNQGILVLIVLIIQNVLVIPE